MINKYYNKSGFTLLELIIVMTIIGMLAAATLITFGNFYKKQNLSIAYDNVFTALSEAKSFSLSQVVHDCDEASGGELIGYRVSLSSGTEYVLQEVCYFSATGATTYVSVGNVAKLPSGVSFDSIQPATFYVQTRSGVVNVADSVSIELVDEGGSSRIINVSAAGVISGN